MAQSVLTNVTQRIDMDQVRDVQVTDIVSDGATGFVRSIKLYGEPVENETPSLILEIRVASETSDDLKLNTPQLSF